MKPPSPLAGYSGTPLAKKLGIKSGSVVALVRAPLAFEETLGELPGGVRLSRRASGGRDLTIWFTKSRAELERGIAAMAALLAEKGGLWIAWPKKSSGVATTLTENVVREVALAAGLVDFKVCAIDATWSGLRFARRKAR